MIITNEADYRQHLARKKGIQEDLEALNAEKKTINQAIIAYIGSPQWVKDRGLDDGDGKLITGCMNHELTTCMSTGGPASNPELATTNEEGEADE